MLSQDRTIRFVAFWLSTWAFNIKIPDEIVMDQSAALFGACVQTFTNIKNTNAYISACMDSDTPTPSVYLRTDRFHFVCTIHRIKQEEVVESDENQDFDMNRGMSKFDQSGNESYK